ncbi:alpha/beta hydrolase [Hydrogenophaga sp.]|uniref:alpha/beta hydrolase n=1 Tax=Hydrogenophaga sp. TaxID=1904254 RepID=UPI00271E15A4|nr:alpha/beta fold hydrolase [Hydrogenophaga sp.]MDO9603277.1 alpha/beta fold hydrolase [Hydrogenophaga sp.]
MRVHFARIPRPDAGARLLLLHGAGGHSGALWPLAALAADRGFDVLAPDLPGYGLTEVPNPGAITYPHWVDCVADLLREQTAADARPLVLLGGSMGGLLGYSASARVPDAVDHLLVTCLLDCAILEKLSRGSPEQHQPRKKPQLKKSRANAEQSGVSASSTIDLMAWMRGVQVHHGAH